ncbi:uncharacterized protein LOC126809668 [Patella vulgata]|uniref:uncharacterized protein LOC126809668 n=1 Tax=Patella vulgata TaxID=6465 RepID=UPI0024A83421|nr:uncharacterized protein LOC126809668 [Patella vulgata]
MASRALLKAVNSARLKQTRLLLESGAPTEFKDECGQTALTKAIFLENDKTREKMVRLLLSKGADCGRLDAVGRTALSWACLFGREPSVTMILECCDMDLNLRDINGQAPLYHAVSSGNAAVVKKMVMALKRYDLSVDLEDNNGVSPLMHAVRLGHDICASILTIQGCAKVGLGMKYPEDFFSAQKWATKSLRDRDRLNPRKSQFPPILANRAFVTMKCASPVANSSAPKAQYTAGFSDDSESIQSEDDYSSDEFEEYLYTSAIPQDYYLSNCGIPQSILAASPTESDSTLSSTIDEVDTYSTIMDDKKIQKSDDLPQMFCIIQDQMSPSYREASTTLADSIQNLCYNESQSSISSTSSKGKRV